MELKESDYILRKNNEEDYIIEIAHCLDHDKFKELCEKYIENKSLKMDNIFFQKIEYFNFRDDSDLNSPEKSKKNEQITNEFQENINEIFSNLDDKEYGLIVNSFGVQETTGFETFHKSLALIYKIDTSNKHIYYFDSYEYSKEQIEKNFNASTIDYSFLNKDIMQYDDYSCFSIVFSLFKVLAKQINKKNTEELHKIVQETNDNILSQNKISQKKENWGKKLNSKYKVELYDNYKEKTFPVNIRNWFKLIKALSIKDKDFKEELEITYYEKFGILKKKDNQQIQNQNQQQNHRQPQQQQQQTAGFREINQQPANTQTKDYQEQDYNNKEQNQNRQANTKIESSTLNLF